MTTLSIAAIDFEHVKFDVARIMAETAAVPRDHPSHTFGVVDDCIRCLDCEVLRGGLKSGTMCPAHIEREDWRAMAAADPSCAFKSPDPFTIEAVTAEQRDGTGCEHCGVQYVFHKRPADIRIAYWAQCTGFTGPDDDWILRDKYL